MTKGGAHLSCCVNTSVLGVMTLQFEWVCQGGHTGCAGDNPLPALRSSMVTHRAGSVATCHLREQWFDKTCGREEEEERLAEENS